MIPGEGPLQPAVYHPATYSKLVPDQLKAELKKTAMMVCPSGNKMTMMCTNAVCPGALECGDDDCQHCSSKHLNCNAASIKLTNVTGKINRMNELKAKCLEHVRLIDGKCISQLDQSQRELSTNPSFCGLSKEDLDVFARIFLKEGSNIKGKDTSRFSHNLK
jgi:hypothetical protein